MQEVTPGLYVGSLEDYQMYFEDRGIVVVHAAKEPYHRRFVGYTSLGCPKDSSEYLFAHRGTRLALNMVDSSKPEFFAREMIDEALTFLREQHMQQKRYVMIHCNEGKSRAPGLALLYMATQNLLPAGTYDVAEHAFLQRRNIYTPGEGWKKHLRENWDYYMKKHHV